MTCTFQFDWCGGLAGASPIGMAPAGIGPSGIGVNNYSDSPQRPPKVDHGAPSIPWIVAAGKPLPGGPTTAPEPEPSTTWSTTCRKGSGGRPGMHASWIGIAPSAP